MTLPVSYGCWLLCSANVASAGAPWMIVASQVCHLPFSMAYHICCARIASGVPVDDTPYRCLDQSGTHVMATITFLCLSQSGVFTLVLALPWNAYCICMLWLRAKTEVRYSRFVRMFVSALLALSPMAFNEQWRNWLGSMFCFAAGSALFGLDALLGGWGHPLMHVMGVPYIHYILTAAI
ncbi:unnamed protein product [Prorocentrum cordatum]|uniref:Post-GPI attachment to proteins factor 3 n=1 Tax=Prorocentrum cordatum TaxID=2364126 RepID=A0ABN9Y4K8_9DINO|nr:unnamed protein product [Polarella glacialis]